MIYVLYHQSCLDGFGAAYAAWKLFGRNAEYVGVRYGDGWPTDVDAVGNEIYVLDFSFDRAVLLYQNELASGLVVLDHHKTAKEDLEGLPFAQFNMEKSGAVLAWEYFHGAEPLPKLLAHVEDRDLWRFKLKSTDAVCEALWSYPKDFERWDNYITDKGAFLRLKNEGNLLLLAKRGVVNQTCYGAFVVQIREHRVIACNAPVHVSEVCHELLKRNPDCDYALGFRITRERKWKWSFRSRKGSGIDVSKIAASYHPTGGGHENAAGVNTEGSIFVL